MLQNQWPSAQLPKVEKVNHPSHYGGDTVYEVIKVCKAWLTPQEYIGALKFQFWKYTARAGKKDSATVVEDNEKAQFYHNELIAFEKECIEKGITFQ